jgi:uroporphyrinogen decarboxylase
MTTEMTERENVLRAITHRDPEYVPVRRLDGRVPGMARLIYRNSRALLSGPDRWGVVWAGGIAAKSDFEPEIQGYPVHHPLRDLADLDHYPFPDPDEPGILDGVLDGVDHRQVLVTGELMFPVQDRAHTLMGMDNFLLALIDQPERMHVLLQRIADYQIGIIGRYVALGVEILRGLDDYGTQSSLLLGPRRWRTFIKPELARIVKAAKDGGALFWLHSCGRVMEILPDLVEIGVDILDPVQVRANDQAAAKRLYGDRLCLMGGMDTQQVLTQGTPDEVEAEVKARIELLAPGGGFILAPDTLITMPEANYLAYLAAGARFGRYARSAISE